MWASHGCKMQWLYKCAGCSLVTIDPCPILVIDYLETNRIMMKMLNERCSALGFHLDTYDMNLSDYVLIVNFNLY